ncbi:MAG TPA: restriction endonuclease [Longimicrobiaceae bacterium]|nr:restriction endonuclease [Longimicrobiaceae bacterium]
MPNFWMVRAGEGGYLVNNFEHAGYVAIGYEGAGDFREIRTLEQMRLQLAAAYPQSSSSQIATIAAMAYKFRCVVQKGDRVVTYDPQRREYLLGTITGDYEYGTGVVPDYQHVRRVSWQGRVSRDALGTAAKNTLGSISTLFEPGQDVLRELEGALVAPATPERTAELLEEREESFDWARDDAANRSHEFIKDRILRLSWQDLEQLSAALLRAMGYKTRVSPPGKDRGRDVVASPDGLGFQSPRIIVQVKHTKATTSGETIRAFLGALQTDDKALFVSTSGFTADAKFESERARFAVSLVDLDELARLVVEYYDGFDSVGRSLLPLTRIYWPSS